MEKIELVAEIRIGDEKLSTIRNSKKVPCVVYGHSQEPILLKLDHSDILKTYRKAGESHIINLIVGKKDIEVLIHDFQKAPVTGDFIHVDFYAITKGEKLITHIPLHFIWESQAKREGAIIEEHIKEIEVKCLPKDLVDNFEVDLSLLVEFGDVVRVSDVKIDSSKFEVLVHGEEVIVSAAKPKVIEESDETPAEVTEEVKSE